MRYGKVISCILTLVLLLSAAAISLLEDPPEAEREEVALSALISTQQGTEMLSCWEQKPGRFFFFLPSYTAPEQVTFQVGDHQKITIGGHTIENGTSLEAFQMNMSYDILVEKKDQSISGVIKFMHSAEVPAVHIDVRSGDMAYIHAEKGNKEPGTIRVYAPDGELDYSGALESINARGNVTWEHDHDRKPYSVKLAAQADLLGMGAAQKWILVSNSFDASNLRNKAVYDFADKLGLAFSPDSTWVDLYLNGEYAGLYLLCERNEIHPERVAVAETGSTLVSIDIQQRMARQGYPHVIVDGDTALRLHSGEKVTEEMTAFWKTVDNAIQAKNGIDPVTGKHYLDMIDLDSWVRKYVIEEGFGNVEASAVSHYFYIDGNDETGRIYAGPVWDYDYALGSSGTWQTGTVQAFFCAKPYTWKETDTPWFYALWQKEEFRNQVIEVYETEFRPLLQQLLDVELDMYAAHLRSAARMNQIRWYQDTCPAEEEIQRIKEYLTQRMDFLDSVWLEGETYYTVTANRTDESVVSCFAVRPGDFVPELPGGNGEDAIGWYDYDTEEPFDITQPIYENKRIYVKREEPLPVTEGTLRLAIRYAPITGLLLILLAIWTTDWSRRKGTEKQNHERTKTNQISA